MKMNQYLYSLIVWMIVSLLVGLIQFEEVRVCAMTCKPGWSNFGGSCYKLYTSTKTWMDALKACQAEDSSLVDIASNDEQVFVYELSKGLQAWLGGSDASVEGHWLWYSSDQPWGYTHWDPRQPDDYRGNEDCLQFWNADLWNDYVCSGALPMPYICEQRAGLSLCDSTWTYNDAHCYKLFKTKMRWSNAMETCQQNSASLVNIETPTEMTFVHGLSEGVAIWLGATDGPQEGNWAWTGTSAKWNYTNWQTGEPNNANNADCAVKIGSEEKWDDGSCSAQYMFMCEKNNAVQLMQHILTLYVSEEVQDTGFMCTFLFSPSDAQVRVLWSLNDQAIKEETLQNQNSSFLQGDEIPMMYNEDKIQCTLVFCWMGNCTKEGLPTSSKLFTAKVQVASENPMTIHEGSGPVNMNLTSTVPPILFCDQKHRFNNCEISVSAELVKHRWDIKCPGSRCPVSQAVFGVLESHSYRPCSYLITMDNWDSGVVIPVKAASDGLKDRNQGRNIRIYLNNSNKTEVISTVPVTIVDGDKIAVCSSINDPHMTTFDGRYYDNYLEGEFILYRHKSLPYEVRTYYRRCNNVAACNCAVVVRSVDDVILIDVCGPSMGQSSRRTPHHLKMYLNGDLTPGTEIIRIAGGKSYEIMLPTGAKVIVMDGRPILGRRFLNVKVVASTYDYNNTEGLCGTFDGNRANDFTERHGNIYTGGGLKPNQFSSSWRVSEDESLYRGYCVTTEPSFKVDSYCDCLEGQTPMCQEGMDLMRCVEIERRRGLLGNKRGVKLLTPELIRDAESPPIRCSSTTPSEKFEYDPKYISPEREWPTPSNINETFARKICVDFMGSDESGRKCMNVPGLDLTPIVQGCVNDILLTDDQEWAKEGMDNLQQQCKTIVEGDTEKWTINNETGDSVPPPDIIGTICPNMCSINGNCSEGFCECVDPWIGDDCSVNSTAPPTLFEVGTGEPCDSVCYNCSFIKMYGDDFADVENLTCHFRFLHPNLTSTSKETTRKAEYFNRGTVTCVFPGDGLYEVAVSNNGHTTSDYIRYIIYNSYCHTCTGEGCVPRTDVCRIDGRCYPDGFFRHHLVTSMCDITKSNKQWSPLEVKNIPMRSFLFHNMYIPAGRNSITIAGIGNPTFDTCLTRGKGIYLNENQHISFEDVTGSCFGDVAKCNLGITFVLNIKLRNQTSKCYLFSNGGEEATNYGYAMWFENNKLYVRISTKRLEWMTYTSAVKMEELIQIEMSWSRQKGIQLRINKETKAASNQCISRPATSYTVNKDIVIGGSSKGDNGCLMILEYFTVVYAFRDIVNGTGILPDLGTHCDRNTTEEVQCQAAVQMTSTDIAFVSTFGIASALFACIIILFIFIGCRRRRRRHKKKRTFYEQNSDQSIILQKKSLQGPRSIPIYWNTHGAHFYRYARADLQKHDAHRYGDSKTKNRKQTKSSLHSDRFYAANDDKVDTRSKYHNSESHNWYENSTFEQERSGNSSRASEWVVRDHRNDISTAHSSWMERSSSEVRQNMKDNSKAESERFEATAWMPVEREETDIAVYQTSESKQRYESDIFRFDRHTKTKDEMSEVENSIVAGTLMGHQEHKESVQNASIANKNSSKFYQWSEKLDRCQYCCSHKEANKNMAVYCAPKKTSSAVDSGCQTDVPLVPLQTLNIQGDVLQLEDGQMNRQRYGRIDYDHEKSGWEHYSVKKSSSTIMMSSGEQTDESKSHYGADSSSRKFEDRVISEKVAVKEDVGCIYSSNPRPQDKILSKMQVRMSESKANELGQRAGEKSGKMRSSLNSDTVALNIKAKGKNRSESCKYELPDERQNEFLRIKITGTDTNSWTTETISKENEKHSFEVVTPSTSKINIDAEQKHLQHKKNGPILSVGEDQEQTVWLEDGSMSSKTKVLSSGEMEGYELNSNDGMRPNSSGLFEIRTYWLPDEKNHKVRSLSDHQLSEEKQKHSSYNTHVAVKTDVTKMQLTDPSIPVQHTMSESKSEKKSATISRNESNEFFRDRAHRLSEEMSKRITVFTTEQPAESKERMSVFSKKGVFSTQQKDIEPIEIQSKNYRIKETATAMIPISYGEHEQGYLLNRYKIDGTEGSGMDGVVFRSCSSDGGIFKTEEWKTFQKEHNGQNLSKNLSTGE